MLIRRILSLIMRQTDIILASFVLLFSGMLCLYQFGIIITNEGRGNSNSFLFPLFEKNFQIVSKGNCVGQFDTSGEIDPGTNLYLKGALLTGLNGNVVRIISSGRAYFNPLGQLTTVDLKIKAGEVELKLNADNPNPINVQIRINGVQGERKWQFDLPGPIMADTSNRQEIKIDFWPIVSRIGPIMGTMLPGGYGLSTLTQLIKTGDLQIRAVAPNESCDIDSPAAVAWDLSELMRNIKGLIGQFKSKLPMGIYWGSDLQFLEED